LQSSQNFHGEMCLIMRHEQVVMVIASDDVAADSGLGQSV